MREPPAQAPAPHRYAPVGVRAVLRDPGSPGHWRVLACWILALVLAIGIGALQQRMGWEGTPVQVGAAKGTLLLHPHMLTFGLIALWFGFSWGYAGAVLAGAVLLVLRDVSLPWAVIGAGTEGLGLLAITLCYRAVPIRVVPSTPFALMSFILVALIASLTGSPGALFYRTAGAETLAQLSGSWIGPFIQWVFIAGPLLLILGPGVQRLKQQHLLGERWTLPDRSVVGATVTVIGATMVLSVAGNRVASRARMADLLQAAGEPGWSPDAEWMVQVGSLLDGTQATSAFSMMLLVCVTLVGYQVAVSWSRTTEAQAAALRESEARNRALVEAIPDLVLRIRADGTVLDHKDGLGLLGTSDIKGQSITEFWPSRITHPLLGRAEDALARGSSVVEFRMDTDQGLRDYEARLVAFGQKEVVAIVRDVTQQRSAVRDNRRTMVRVTRDLRAPLTSVRGALGLIRGGVAGEIGAKATQLVDVAYRNAERMVRLAEDILATEGPGSSSGKRLKLEQVDLARLVEASVYELRKRADELGVQVEVTGVPTEARVKVDPDRVVEVVHVLLNNALTFSPSAGRVAVSVRRSRDIFRVEVRDEGHGIPEAFQGRVFRRGPHQGQGGLSMARDIVLTLGGRIGFESKLGRGTTFWFELPEQLEQRQLKPRASANRRATIL